MKNVCLISTFQHNCVMFFCLMFGLMLLSEHNSYLLTAISLDFNSRQNEGLISDWISVDLL